MNIAAHEREKYEKVWQIDRYGDHSPGLQHVDLFWSIARPNEGQTLLDIGAGAGLASMALRTRGLDVTGFDLTDEAWIPKDIPFSEGCLWHGLPLARAKALHDYGYCCDVMEHVPTEYVGLAITNILSVCGHAFFSISFTQDSFGKFIGEPLHLTVKPFAWWRDLLRELGTLHEARDLIGEGCFYVSR